LAFALEQNYPNPFNPSTTIPYELPKATFVSLKIYNTLGQLVVTLVDAQKEAGYHQVQWKPDVPSGIYFYRLQAGEFIGTKKMILLR
jgi:flagellar hook assembly protein FlgD